MPRPRSDAQVPILGPGSTRRPVPGAYHVPTGAIAGDVSSVENIVEGRSSTQSVYPSLRFWSRGLHIFIEISGTNRQLFEKDTNDMVHTLFAQRTVNGINFVRCSLSASGLIHEPLPLEQIRKCDIQQGGRQ